MSAEHAKAFIERMKTDEAFREQIMAIESPEERLKAINEAGFACTAAEINETGNCLKERENCSAGLRFPPDFIFPSPYGLCSLDYSPMHTYTSEPVLLDPPFRL